MKMDQTLNALKRPNVYCKRVVKNVNHILRFAAFSRSCATSRSSFGPA